jgi:hypothetical protein
MHVNFFILNNLPIPTVGLLDPRSVRVSNLSASLASIDARFAKFATSCGVSLGLLAGEAKEDAIAEIDALVASMYGLAADDLETIFADFTYDAVPEERRNAVRQHFARISAELPVPA